MLRNAILACALAGTMQPLCAAPLQSRTVHFDKAGVVALGCNIHDQMSAFIFVADSAWTARTNAQGIANFQLRLRPPPPAMSMSDY